MDSIGRAMTLAKALTVAIALVAGMPVVHAQRAETQRADLSRNGPIALAPHRAVYDFTLGTVRSDKSISGLTGRMVYEFTGSTCEGWSQKMRFVTRTTAASGTTTMTDQRSTSWEDDAATVLRFSSSQYRDQKMIEQTGGTATRPAGAEDIKIELTHPEKGRAGVAGSAMFPIQHSVKLLDAARRGRPSLTADFYDGADGGEKIYVVSAQIGKPVASNFNRSLPRVGQVEKLDGMQAWPMLLSYFEPGNESKDALPAYEMGFVFYANGVSRRLVIDNGEYTMKGELSEFSYIDPLPCKK